MICNNCKKEIEDGISICPHCNKETVNRCPNCWARLNEGEKTCTKCGCNISEYIKESEEIRSYTPPTLSDKIRKLPKWLKISVPALLAVVIALSVVISAVNAQKRQEEIKHASYEMVVMADGAIELITELAESYEKEVYSKDWITYIESAQALREKSKDKTDEIKKMREPISHRRDVIKALGGNKAGKMADRVYFCYSECYSYVVGENGKYPNYLKKYKKLVEEYEEATEELLDLFD